MIERILLNAEINEAIERFTSARKAFNQSLSQEDMDAMHDAYVHYTKSVNKRSLEMGMGLMYGKD